MDKVNGTSATARKQTHAGQPSKMTCKEYEHEMRFLHGERVPCRWVKTTGAKLGIVFEGRDTAARAERSSASPNE
jgi:polyphosphate kinase